MSKSVKKCQKVSNDLLPLNLKFYAMIIKADYIYSLKEVHEILKIHPRKLNRVAVKHKLEKVDNRYLFKGSFILDVFKKEVSKSVEGLSKSVKPVSNEINPFESIKEQFERYKIEQIEDIDFKFNYSGELSQIGNLVFVPKSKVYAIYTESEYEFSEAKLNEWRFQQKEIEKQAAEIEDIKATSTERVEHYKNLFEYQRKQSDRILQIHEKLVTSINELTKANVQRNIIEAKDKDVINDKWKTK